MCILKKKQCPCAFSFKVESFNLLAALDQRNYKVGEQGHLLFCPLMVS